MRKGNTTSVFTQDDHAFFQRNGYVVVHDAVPAVAGTSGSCRKLGLW
jgi:hypothetical protein